MKPSNISHVIADVSYIGTPQTVYKLKILVGDEYEDKISEQLSKHKDVDLSDSNNLFYVRSIDELRGLMRETPRYDFVITSYLVYSFHESSSERVYISSFGGKNISSSNVKNYLLNSFLKVKDEELLSNFLEMFSGYECDYDVEKDSYTLSDQVQNEARKERIGDDEIINSVFSTDNSTDLSHQDIIKMMRDKNQIPFGLEVRDEFIALEPVEIITLASGLIESEEEATA